MRTRQKLSKCDRNMNINEILIDFVNQIKIENISTFSHHWPVPSVVHLQPGEDRAAGDEGSRQAAEPLQVTAQQLPHRLLQV